MAEVEEVTTGGEATTEAASEETTVDQAKPADDFKWPKEVLLQNYYVTTSGEGKAFHLGVMARILDESDLNKRRACWEVVKGGQDDNCEKATRAVTAVAKGGVLLVTNAEGQTAKLKLPPSCIRDTEVTLVVTQHPTKAKLFELSIVVPLSDAAKAALSKAAPRAAKLAPAPGPAPGPAPAPAPGSVPAPVRVRSAPPAPAPVQAPAPAKKKNFFGF